MDPEKDKERKDEDLVVDEKKVGEEENVVEENKGCGGAEVAAPTRSRRKRRRKKRVVENDPGAACAQQVVPHHVPNGRPAGESDSDPEDDDLHPFTCSCPECQLWRQPPGKDNDDPEKWLEDQLDKSTL